MNSDLSQIVAVLQMQTISLLYIIIKWLLWDVGQNKKTNLAFTLILTISQKEKLMSVQLLNLFTQQTNYEHIISW